MQRAHRYFVGILILGMLVLFMQVNISNANNERSYQELLADYKQNNTDLKKIELDLADAKRSFQQSKQDVEDASSSWSNLVNMFNMIGREITPQMKYSTVMQRGVALENAKLTIARQELSAKTKQDNQHVLFRDTYSQYWSANTQLENLKKQLTIAQTSYDKNQLLFKQGKLSLQELKKSEIAYIDSQNKVTNSERELMEKQQSLNSLLGVEFSTNYEYEVWEKQEILQYNPVDKYVEKALEERLDVIVLKDQIAMNELNIDTYDEYFSYSSMTDNMQESYDALKDSNYYLQLELNQKKVEIEKELREAFLDLKYEEYKLKTLLNIRNDANTNYLKMKELISNGNATEVELIQSEQKYSDAHNNYLISIYNFNTQVYRFRSMSGAGLNISVSGTQGLSNTQGGGR